MKRTLTVAKILAVIFTILLVSGISQSYAGGSGTFTSLYFPGADANTCGGWNVATSLDQSQFVSFWRPGIVQYTLIDGTQRVISQGTQNIFDGFASNVERLRLPSFSLPSADWTGARNPIRAIVTVDGDQIADLTADNPCLPAATGQVAPPANNQTGECMVSAVRNGIRLRGGPGTTYNVLGNLQARQSYAVEGQGRDAAGVIWWQITVPSVGAAWVISTYSTTSGNCSAVPTVGAAPAAQPTADPANVAACTLSTRTNLRLRGGPGVNYERVGSIQAGTYYAVVGQNTDSQAIVWWQIDAGAVGQAWVISTYVTTHGVCSGVPLVTAPS